MRIVHVKFALNNRYLPEKTEWTIRLTAWHSTTKNEEKKKNKPFWPFFFLFLIDIL